VLTGRLRSRRLWPSLQHARRPEPVRARQRRRSPRLRLLQQQGWLFQQQPERHSSKYLHS
ncbi:MAG: hypothetical protein M3438_10400, partial [Pseudomonadota bacterium]|nr:hypothetical protein [Pseudomonadota bacterium]